MKKILWMILWILMLFSFLMPVYWNCDYDDEWVDIWEDLEYCLNWSDLVWTDEVGHFTVEEAFKDTLNWWTAAIWSILWLLAIGWIAYWAFMMTVSAGEDEAVKKAKDIIKWSIIWFLGVIFASSIIALVVNVMYSIGG